MSEETTRNMSSEDSFKERVLAEFARLNSRLDSMDKRLDSMAGRLDSMDGRLISLEEKVDARLRETRPIWEGMQATLEEIRLQLGEALRDLLTTRTRVARLEESQRQPTA